MDSLKNVQAPLQHRYGVFAASFATVLAVACGGGGGGLAGVGSGGTGFVTGFGSVIVDGVKYEDSALDGANTVKSEEAASDAPVTRDRIKLGQRLEFEFEGKDAAGNDRVKSVVIQSELQGPVSRSGSNVLVAGQVVEVKTISRDGSLTVFDGITSLADLADGDIAEVHGELLSDGSAIRASRVERKPAGTAGVKISGLIGANPSSSSFQLGSITVSIPAGTAVTPTGVVFTAGQRVKVFASSISGNSVTANAVRVKGLRSDRATYRLRGVVASSPAPTSSRFVINGITVDTSALNLSSGTIEAGKNYRVAGSFNSATNTLTVTRAQDFTASNSDDFSRSELKGSITDFVSASNFRVRNVLVDATGLTPQPSSCILANGQFVEVKGAINDASGESKVVASEVTCKSTPDQGSELKQTAAISSLDTNAKTFSLGQQLVSYSSSTEFEDGDASNLANGSLVEVEGRLSGSNLVARKIEFKNRGTSSSTSTSDKEVEGRLPADATVSGSTVTFSVNGQTLTCTDGGFSGLCSVAQLKKGLKLEVRYNSSNVATRMKRED